MKLEAAGYKRRGSFLSLFLSQCVIIKSEILRGNKNSPGIKENRRPPPDFTRRYARVPGRLTLYLRPHRIGLARARGFRGEHVLGRARGSSRVL